MRREPDERYRVTMAAQAEPAHPHEKLLWRCARGLEQSEVMARAIEIYADNYERERLQPWILATEDDRDIAARNGTHVDMIEMYRHLCFNPSVFRDRFEKLRWVNNYERRAGATPEGAMYLRKAVLHGVEAIAHLMGAPVKLEPARVLEQSMQDTHFRSLALRDSRITSAEASAAHQLVKTAVGVAEQLGRVKPPDIGDVLLKLKHRELTQPIEVVNAAGEILH